MCDVSLIAQRGKTGLWDYVFFFGAAASAAGIAGGFEGWRLVFGVGAATDFAGSTVLADAGLGAAVLGLLADVVADFATVFGAEVFVLGAGDATAACGAAFFATVVLAGAAFALGATLGFASTLAFGAGVALGAGGATLGSGAAFFATVVLAGAAVFALVAALGFAGALAVGFAVFGEAVLNAGSVGAGFVMTLDAGAAALAFVRRAVTDFDVEALRGAGFFAVGAIAFVFGSSMSPATGKVIELIKARVMAWDVRMLRSTMRDIKKNPLSEAVIELVANVVIENSLGLSHESGPMTF